MISFLKDRWKGGTGMKKRLVPLLCILFLLTGCAAQSSPLMGKISSELSSVVMTRYDCEGQTEFSLADEQIEMLRSWASGLSLKHECFKEGDSPSDVSGGEVYHFSLPDGDFSYRINGPDSCYLYTDGEWYRVRNPSFPFVLK